MKFKLISILLLVLFLGAFFRIAFCGTPPPMQVEPENQNVKPKLETSGTEIAIRLLISILIISILIYVSVWGLKKLSAYRIGRGRSAGSIEIIENAFIGPKKGLHIIRAGGKYILVGSSDSTISHICDLDAADFDNHKPQNTASRPAYRFRDVLNRLKPGTEKTLLRRAGNAEITA